VTGAGGVVVRVAGVPALLRYRESPGGAAGARDGRIAYVEYPGVRHALTRELIAESERGLAAWFQRWLP
jgi:hypothetical protein